LKPNAPLRVITTPDLDKLQRSTLDALTGVLFKDDSQVCRILAMKCYCLEGELEGCEIVVEGIEVGK
jgi:Holliday junction resolvase RusA-like endonuclease